MHPVTTASSRVCRRTAIPAEAMKMTRSTLARHQRDTALSLPDIAARVASLDWPALAAALDAHGCATTGTILTADECSALRDVYGAEEPFRSRIVMARHGFGRGEYKYFAYPLPEIVAALRAALYQPLADIANRWNEAMGIAVRYPAKHAAYLARCHAAGQTQADAPAAAVRRGRLQLPAPGRLWRACLPAAGRLPAVAARRRFRRRRVRPHRAAPAHAVASRGRAARSMARP